MSNMKKTVSARDFLHHFAKLERGLRPGESILITRRGQPLGRFTKEPVKTVIPRPDFEEHACRPGFNVKDGNALLARMLRDEELS